MALIIIVAYILIGSVWNAWHPGWLIVFLIPIWDSLLEAIERRNAAKFAYPVLMVLLYLCLGFFGFLWHPGWVVFLTIPVYYSLVDYFKDRSSNKKNNWEATEEKESRESESPEQETFEEYGKKAVKQRSPPLAYTERHRGGILL